MDKMGSSEDAGNKGQSATPRDGAPIELVAMQYSVLSWLSKLHQSKIIKDSGVKIEFEGKPRTILFMNWAK